MSILPQDITVCLFTSLLNLSTTAADETSFQADLMHCPPSATYHLLTFPAAVSGQFQITAIPHAGESL
jgi:hypothetical protein